MPGLVLKLRPGETVFVNGVEIENGERKTRLNIKTGGAKVFRKAAAISPEHATTPARRAYFLAQLCLSTVDGEADLERLLAEALAAMDADAEGADLARGAAEARDFYGVIKALRPHVEPCLSE